MRGKDGDLMAAILKADCRINDKPFGPANAQVWVEENDVFCHGGGGDLSKKLVMFEGWKMGWRGKPYGTQKLRGVWARAGGRGRHPSCLPRLSTLRLAGIYLKAPCTTSERSSLISLQDTHATHS